MLTINEYIAKVYNDAEFESKHPRDKIGRFTKSGNGSNIYKELIDAVEKSNEKNYTNNEILKMFFENAENKNVDFTKDELVEAMKKAEQYNKSVIPTELRYKIGDKYTADREKEHKIILNEIFKNADNAKPKNGEKPTFIMLGGRGGSGKSKFNGLVYDKNNYIVLDADAIKEKLPEYTGFNAFEVHEESSHILKEAIATAQELGLNVVLDGTMKSLNSSEKHLKGFKDAGYNIEMYYMHLPREISTQRALGRFMKTKDVREKGQIGRYVPLDVLLSMKDNEKNFDNLKHYASKWAFYSNKDILPNEKPKLIAQS